MKSSRLETFAKLMTPMLRSVLQVQAKGRVLHRAAEILVAATRERLEKGLVPKVLPEVDPRFRAC